MGLTATPERSDGEDMLELFQNVAHKMDLKTAVERGVLVSIRCIRVKTNIDLTDVRINGIKYNSQDLESKLFIPERNQLIVDTYLKYVNGKKTVIFCASMDSSGRVELHLHPGFIIIHQERSVNDGTNVSAVVVPVIRHQFPCNVRKLLADTLSADAVGGGEHF